MKTRLIAGIASVAGLIAGVAIENTFGIILFLVSAGLLLVVAAKEHRYNSRRWSEWRTNLLRNLLARWRR